jgi:hypothetical protein
VSFVEQLERSSAVDVFTSQPDVLASYDEFNATMHRLLDALPEPARTLRVRHVQMLIVHVAAERERAVNRDDAREPFGLFVSAVIDGFVGFLEAPASADTRRLATRADAATSP